jgi:transcriptional regulator with XRE-family HTH domain
MEKLIHQSLGQKVRHIRLSAEMTQKEFAEALECTQQTISAIEMDRGSTSYKMLQKLKEFIEIYALPIKFELV